MTIDRDFTLKVPPVSRLTIALSLMLLLVLAACGGQPASAPSDDAATDQAEPTDGPSDDGGTTDGGTTDGGGEGDANSYCLNTVDEVASALGVEVASADGIANAGLGGGCMYNGPDGMPVMAISVVDNEAAADAFEGYRQYEGAEEVSGIGDAALFLPMNEMIGIAFMKGDVVASIGPTVQLDLSDDALRAAVEELARRAADGL